jgi:hypothetical protein
VSNLEENTKRFNELLERLEYRKLKTRRKVVDDWRENNPLVQIYENFGLILLGLNKIKDVDEEIEFFTMSYNIYRSVSYQRFEALYLHKLIEALRIKVIRDHCL